MGRRIRGFLITAALCLAGAAATTHRARRCIPFYPMDLVSYIGANCAARDGGNPYDTDDARASLFQRGLRTAPLRFLYSPAFLGGMPPPDSFPYRYYRLVWTGASVLAAWASILLLSGGTGRLKPLFTTGAFVFLLFSEPLQDNLVCGQIMSFILLALSVIVFRGFGGVLSGVASGFLAVGKLCFLPLACFFRGKRAAVAFVLSVAIPCLLSLHFAGSQVYADYFRSIGHFAATQGFAQSNNFGITHAVALLTEEALVSGDAGRAVNDFGYRVELARRQGNAMWTLSIALAVLTAFAVLHGVHRGGKSGAGFSREDLFSLAILYILVFAPCVWIHYGLLLVLPFRTVAIRRGAVHAMLFILGMMLWGMPFSVAPGWPRFLVPMFWLFFLALGGKNREKVRAPGASFPGQRPSSPP